MNECFDTPQDRERRRRIAYALVAEVRDDLYLNYAEKTEPLIAKLEAAIFALAAMTANQAECEASQSGDAKAAQRPVKGSGRPKGWGITMQDPQTAEGRPYVACGGVEPCAAPLVERWTAEEAAEAWNTRAATEIERLTEAGQAFVDAAHRQGPTSDEYWTACKALEAALKTVGSMG